MALDRGKELNSTQLFLAIKYNMQQKAMIKDKFYEIGENHIDHAVKIYCRLLSDGAWLEEKANNYPRTR